MGKRKVRDGKWQGKGKKLGEKGKGRGREYGGKEVKEKGKGNETHAAC